MGMSLKIFLVIGRCVGEGVSFGSGALIVVLSVMHCDAVVI